MQIQHDATSTKKHLERYPKNTADKCQHRWVAWKWVQPSEMTSYIFQPEVPHHQMCVFTEWSMAQFQLPSSWHGKSSGNCWWPPPPHIVFMVDSPRRVQHFAQIDDLLSILSLFYPHWGENMVMGLSEKSWGIPKSMGFNFFNLVSWETWVIWVFSPWLRKPPSSSIKLHESSPLLTRNKSMLIRLWAARGPPVRSARKSSWAWNSALGRAANPLGGPNSRCEKFC